MAKTYDDEDGVWRTIGGRRVFIRNGQSLSDAMKESGKFKKAETKNAEIDKKENPYATNNKGGIDDNSSEFAEHARKHWEDINEKYKKEHNGEEDEMAKSFAERWDREKKNREYGESKIKEKEEKDNETWRDKLNDKDKRNEILDRELDESTKKKVKEYWEKEDAEKENVKIKEGNPIADMADERVKEKQNALEMNKMFLDNMKKNNIDKLPDGTTKEDLEFKIWENQNYIDKATNNFENLKKNTMSDAEKEKYMKDNNITNFTSRDEYNYMKNKVKSGDSIDYKGNLQYQDRDGQIKNETKLYENVEVDDDGNVYYNGTKLDKDRIIGVNKEVTEQNKKRKEELDELLGKSKKEKATNDDINNAIREKASKKTKAEPNLPKRTEIKEQGTSNRKEVSENIQAHILDYYDDPQDFVEQMEYMHEPNMWRAGEELASGGSYAIYTGDQREFLDSLKINPSGKEFSDDKVFNTYKSLIGRESAKLYDRLKRNAYNEYKREHPLSKMTFDEFKEQSKK